ncbi:uncharacterized protein LY89DRAFT_778082 [Mollisia scopiformis]|uniref:Utp8 beta-propeller domain-containing protein n=1 Tax=Mollisia scopiformis TaxID=149040 RepID=A0A194XN58_MOLSC|nr:uncharacterized protein LY89DRAFT_778082 [Mollisia scopiformis]KUJ21685.1 hypothetical protein LY89DRAFT_778082 [Mollisia scopiformis]
MSSRFSIQRPHVIASLPQPIDSTNGCNVVGEVISGGVGTKKRKRSELAVGTDGEGLSLYDISSSKLITSYALPPQSSFTCPPVSVRSKISKNTIERRTYVSTRTSNAELTLFRETISGLSTESSTINHSLTSSSSQVVFLGTIGASKALEATAATVDVLSVHEDGEIRCFDGDSLQERWVSPSTALFREAPLHPKETKVEFAQLTNAHTASQGILKGRQDVFALYPQEISVSGFNPAILIVITKSTQEAAAIRTLHVLSLPRRAAIHTNGLQQSVDSLLAAEIPSAPGTENIGGPPTFSLQAASGVLQQLRNETLTTFDLSDTLPKEQNRLKIAGGQSFLRLSSTSVLVSSPHSMTVYNPKYQSTLATVELDAGGSSESRKRKRESMDQSSTVQRDQCKLVGYFPRLAVAIAILGNKLVGLQVEGHQDRQGRLQTAGLLIDSIGRSFNGHMRPTDNPGVTKINNITTLGHFLPTGYDIPWADQTSELETLFRKGECDEALFDSKIASHLGMDGTGEPELGQTNGSSSPTEETHNPVPNTNISTKERLSPSDIDRRWVVYALSKMFKFVEDDAGESRLSLSFYPPDTFMWLLTNGFMTIANIEAGLRMSNSAFKSLPDGCLVDMIVDTDRDMDLLLVLVAKNYLGAAELLHVIRHLMESLGLLGENPNTKQGLLENGEDFEIPNGDVEKQFELLEAEMENDLELAEYRLGAGSGTRGHALSQALSKLYARPSTDIVRALQTTFSSQEIVCLIYLLRFELARGAWTTKYTETTEFDAADEETAQQDNAIILLSGLLNNCVDAIGAGGWLSGEARLVDGDPFEAEELISSLKLEISAALEGIEEAVYLKGLTSEMIRYGDAVEAALPNSIQPTHVPVILPPTSENTNFLPVGLKVEKPIALSKVGVGGAVHQRTKRDIGYLKSQKVGKYSRERIRV